MHACSYCCTSKVPELTQQKPDGQDSLTRSRLTDETDQISSEAVKYSAGQTKLNTTPLLIMSKSILFKGQDENSNKAYTQFPKILFILLFVDLEMIFSEFTTKTFLTDSK